MSLAATRGTALSSPSVEHHGPRSSGGPSTRPSTRPLLALCGGESQDDLLAKCRQIARLARKTGAPVVPTFALCDQPGHYRLRYEEPVMVDDLSETELDDVPLTARYMAILEAAIRENPDQWLWYHDRWKQVRLKAH